PGDGEGPLLPRPLRLRGLQRRGGQAARRAPALPDARPAPRPRLQVRQVRDADGVRRHPRAVPLLPRGAVTLPKSVERARVVNAVPEVGRKLLDGSVDAAVVLDENRRPLYWNAAYEAYTGLRPRALEQAASGGRCCHHVFPIEVCETMCLGKRALEI